MPRKISPYPRCSTTGTPCSSTKGQTGHTLGAAGIVEAIILRAGDSPWPAARQRAHGNGRSIVPQPLSTGQRAGTDRYGAQQLLRLRRQQLQPDLRADAVMQVFVEGIGIIAPGLDGWSAARFVLAGRAPYETRPVRPPPVELLPPAERRRAGLTVRLAIAAGIEALRQAARDPADMAMVFTASGGDGETIHEILSVLVHRAARSITDALPQLRAQCTFRLLGGRDRLARTQHQPERVRSAASSQACWKRRPRRRYRICPVTLIAYDVPYPEPLHAARPIGSLFGMALVLAPRGSDRGSRQ